MRRALGILVLVGACFFDIASSAETQVGVFYFPGWRSDSEYWRDLQGLAGSRSSGTAWPEREPLLGFSYAEEDPRTAEQEIAWASDHGITFFTYDWYWNGEHPVLEHAINAYRKARNKHKVGFSVLWANHSEIPRTLQQFDAMVACWIREYFTDRSYYRIDGKPVVFVFSYHQLDLCAKKFGQSAASLLMHADAQAVAAGFKGIYFVATTNEKPSDAVERMLSGQGFSAYTGWNYAIAGDARQASTYDAMVDTYLAFYDAAARRERTLPFFAPASPGYDDRPWKGTHAYVRESATPEKFKRMLLGAQRLLNRTDSAPRVLMIMSWNEYGEGAYIAPTKRWGMEYLQTIQQVFGRQGGGR